MPLYFLAIIPPEEICRQVKFLKLEISDKYKAKQALKLPAHITLQIPFKLPVSEERKLIDILENAVEKQVSFRVALKDFGRFNQKVIFINIEDHHPIKNLHSDIQKVLSENFSFKKHEAFSKIHPHITLATRDLHYKQFPQAWTEFKNRDFTASFSVKNFILLKHDGKQWQTLHKFVFPDAS